MRPATQTDGHAGTLAVAVLGADAVLAGLPATPVQLAHACLRSGFDLVVPASWGDELVAGECLRALDDRSARPVVLCACPLVRRELLGAGPDLAPMLIPVVPPPVAVARYLHALVGRERVHVTYIGACPGAAHADIDTHVAPSEFLSILARMGITPADEPTVFDSVIPPDRRRYFSLPGGPPSPEHLWSGDHARSLVVLDGGDVLADVAERLLSRECVLIDLAPAMGCACSGVTHGVQRPHARAATAANEPPRALSAVIDVGVVVDLADPICTGPCVEAVSGDAEPGSRALEIDAADSDLRSAVARRRSPAAGVRAIQHAVPVARVAGRSLPRAYVSRRRLHADGDERARATSAGAPIAGQLTEQAPAPAVEGNGRSDQSPAQRRASARRATVAEAAAKPTATATPRRSRRIVDGPES